MRIGQTQILRVVIVALSCLLGAASQACASVRVAVFMTDSLTATLRTVYGAEKAIQRLHPEAEFSYFALSNDGDKSRQVIDSTRKLQPRLVLTIGTAATQFAREHLPTMPIVFAAVKYPELSGFVQSTDHPGGNLTGASLDIPVDVQFRYFKKIVPGLKRVGVLYTDSTARLIPPARASAGALNLELLPIKVSNTTDLPRALDSVAALSQGLWSLADPNLFDRQTTRFILLNVLRKGLPLMGFSRHVVESGALFALDFDYKAVGRQAGEIANRVISGEHPSGIPVTSADVIWFHYNEKTAQHIDIKIPDELVAVAKEVYR